MTFAEIQAQQVAAAMASEAMTPQKKSFAEIQAEDRQAELERLRAEKERLEFEKWFEEESRRVKAEEKAASRQAGGGGGSKEGKKKGRGSTANKQGDEGISGQGDSSTPKALSQAPPKGPKRSSENHNRGGDQQDRGGRGSSARGGRGAGSSRGGGGGGGGRGGKGTAHAAPETAGSAIPTGPKSSSQPRPGESATLSAAAPSFQPSGQ